jgi:cytochrome b-561
MSGFFSSLLENIRALPGNLVRGLRPGVDSQNEVAAKRLRRSFIYHIHPLRVTERALSPWVTLGLGVITATCFFVLAVSGILLMLYYIPTTKSAYQSMEDIQYAVTLGPFVRALHRWAAHAMMITVLLHLVRVAAMGAYYKRELNWVIGLCLAGLVMGLAFTGYLLPWDQRSYWAVSVATAMLDNVPLIGPTVKVLALGGQQIAQATLLRFYMLHVALLPAGLLVLLAFHIWRIRKDGGLAYSKDLPESQAATPAWPHLVLREAVLIIAALVALFLVAMFIDAPLGIPVDPHTPSNPEKAPWYFLWAQEMVSYSAVVGAFVFPLVLSGWLVLLPFLDRQANSVGRWFGGRSCKAAVAMASLAAIIGLVVFEWLYLRGGGADQTIASTPWLADLLNPAAGMIGLALLAAVISGMATGSTRAAGLSGIAVMLVAIVGFTLMGICRGPDWVFYWPWEEWPLVN